ncbi:hypothetical protein BBJ28_00024785 [Nothophytophthora sp. Chile5]|nr:hypothetical protein BBJ28_00024785 [Nothophytophthora sp. Chile5]
MRLEELSDHLHELYTQQFELAKRAAATVMNEKSRLLPTLQSQIPQTTSISPRIPGGALPFSRLRQSNSGFMPSLGLNHDVSVNPKAAAAAHSDRHQLEHYDVPSEPPASSLVGSFPERKPTRQGLATDTLVTQTPSCLAQRPSKRDELSEPEGTQRPIAAHPTEATKQLYLDVTLPLAGSLDGALIPSGNVTTSIAAQTTGARLRRGGPEAPGPPLTAKLEDMPDPDDTVCDEIDVRAQVYAQMYSVASPLRTMRLEPSHVTINALGKYFAASPSPFAEAEGAQQRPQDPPSFGLSPRVKMTRMPLRSIKTGVNVPNTVGPLSQALTRKQGFLTTLRVTNASSFSGDERVFLDAVLPRVHQGRRSFYSLVDSELREYPDSVTLTTLNQTSWLHRYDLHSPSRAIVRDMPVASGEAEALLRQSFLLIVGDATRCVFTAPSMMEKQKWMAELNQASMLGPQHHAPQSVASTLKTPRPSVSRPRTDSIAVAAAVIEVFRGRRDSTAKDRRRSSVLAQDALQVEYRIS